MESVTNCDGLKVHQLADMFYVSCFTKKIRLINPAGFQKCLHLLCSCQHTAEQTASCSAEAKRHLISMWVFFLHRANFSRKPEDETPDIETTDSPRCPWQKGGAERREIGGGTIFSEIPSFRRPRRQRRNRRKKSGRGRAPDPRRLSYRSFC